MADTARKLPVLRIVGRSFSYTFRNIGLLIRISWAWFLVLACLAVVMPYLDEGWTFSKYAESAEENDDVFLAGDLIFLLLHLGALASIAVVWHRVLLLGERPGWFNLQLGLRQLGYVAYGLLVLLLFVTFLAPGVAVMVHGMDPEGGFDDDVRLYSVLALVVGGVLGALAVLGRASLVFAGVAVREKWLSVIASFRLTKSNTLRILAGAMLVYPLITISQLAMLAVPDGALGPTGWAIWFTLDTIPTILVVTFDSYCYQFFVQDGEQDPAT